MADPSVPPDPSEDSDPGVWSVYLLRCGDGTLYCGVTTDPGRRIDQHSAGSGARYTRGRGPLTLVYLEIQPSMGLALRREAAIKRMGRAEKESLIRDAGPVQTPERTASKRGVR